MEGDSGLEQAISAVDASPATYAQRLAAVEVGLDELRSARDGLITSLDGHGAWLADLQTWMTATVQTLASISTLPPTSMPSLQRATPELLDPLVSLERHLRVWVVMSWLAQAEVNPGPLLSVILPTRNRRPWLEQAVASVTAQTYPRWELVVIDDASEDDTWEWLQALDDPRIRVRRGPGASAARARNIGLDCAVGEIIAYLDDDNLMHRDWLKALAWAFARWSDTQFLYGARIIEDDRSSVVSGGAFPSLQFLPFDRGRLEEGNYIDINVQAHRVGIPDARFDEDLNMAADWDLALKLTGREPPLELPAIACSYRSSSPNRVSDTVRSIADLRTVWARSHRSRPLRIVAHTTARSPWRSVDGDLLELQERGATVAVCRPVSGALANRSWPVFHDLADAVADLVPDLIVVYGQVDTVKQLEELAVPVAVRLDDREVVLSAGNGIAGHRLCIGTWSSPRQAGSFHDELSSALTRWRLTEAEDRR